MAGSESELQIFYYGVRIRIAGNSDPVSQQAFMKLKERLNWFKAQSLLDFDTPAIEILIEGAKRPDGPTQGLRRVFETESGRFYGFGSRRVCDYGTSGLAISESEAHKRQIRLFAENAEDLYSLSYATFLSALGEELDARGYHRVNALGLEYGGFAFLLLHPHAAGKSAMASLLTTSNSSSAIRILSDEVSLAHEDWVCPLPLIPIAAAKIGEESLCQAIFIGEPTDGAPGIERASRFQVLKALWKGMVVGIGLTQRVEHLLRLDALPKLIAIAFSRLKTALNLVATSETYFFRVSQDPNANLQTLSQFLQKYPPKELELLRQKRA